MNLLTDEELIEAAQARDLDAFDAFMQRHERLVYKVALNLVQDPDLAFDLTQSTFLKAFQGLARFRHEAQPRTWLLRIATHESLDALRRRRSRGDGHGPLEEEAPELALHPNQEQEVLQRDDRHRLGRAMAKLNERHRLALVLRYFQDLGIPEIARVLGCSEGVTKNMLFRSVRSLRDAMNA